MTGNAIAVMATGGMMTGVAESKIVAMEDMTVAAASVVGRTGTTKTAQQRTAAVVVAVWTMSAVATRTAKLWDQEGGPVGTGEETGSVRSATSTILLAGPTASGA